VHTSRRVWLAAAAASLAAGTGLWALWPAGDDGRAAAAALATLSADSQRLLAQAHPTMTDLAHAFALDVCACQDWPCVQRVQAAHRQVRGERYRLFAEQDPRWRTQLAGCVTALRKRGGLVRK
jgi:hypothetical protein